MRRWTVVVLTALLGSMLALPAAAQWKWRDRTGQTQYSDLPPPPGTAESDILLRPTANSPARRAAPAAPAPASGASGAGLLTARVTDPELEARRKKTEQEATDKKSAEDRKVAAARAENCKSAQADARMFDSGERIATMNAKGERIVMDDAARAAQSKRAHEVIAEVCK